VDLQQKTIFIGHPCRQNTVSVGKKYSVSSISFEARTAYIMPWLRADRFFVPKVFFTREKIGIPEGDEDLKIMKKEDL
jgi:hypothetical protein